MRTNDQTAAIQFLQDPTSYELPPDQIEIFETHGAQVFLAGEKAYKLMKAVYFPYMDYSTLAHRKLCCEAEVFLNQRTAPQIYQRVSTLTQDATGTIHFDGEGEILDYVVVMKRFNPANVLDQVAGRGELNCKIMASLTDAVIQLHQQAESSEIYSGSDSLREVICSNDHQFVVARDVLDRQLTQRLTQQSLQLLDQNTALLDERQRQGKIKRCHGDLHLRNICLFHNQPVLFDCIEFNDALATIDTFYDLAFLLMDLDYRGYRDYANLVLNRYLSTMHEYDAIALLPLMLATRAAIRSHVSVAIGQGLDSLAQENCFHEARTYLEIALRYLEATTPQLIAIGGLSGSGKSTLAAALAPSLGSCPGAIVLRTDVIRKMLAGIAPEKHLDASHYTPARSEKVYQTLSELAKPILANGHSVILDGVFAQESQREAVAALAQQAQVRFQGFWLEIPNPVATARINRRQGDVSDADSQVRQLQQSFDLGKVTWQILEGDQGILNLAQQAQSACQQLDRIAV